MRGLDTFQKTIDDMCAGGPDAITMHKGLAERCFGQHAGITPLVLKCTTFSPYQPDFDTPVATVEEGVRLGADAVSIGCIVCGDKQPRSYLHWLITVRKQKSWECLSYPTYIQEETA